MNILLKNKIKFRVNTFEFDGLADDAAGHSSNANLLCIVSETPNHNKNISNEKPKTTLRQKQPKYYYYSFLFIRYSNNCCIFIHLFIHYSNNCCIFIYLFIHYSNNCHFHSFIHSLFEYLLFSFIYSFVIRIIDVFSLIYSFVIRIIAIFIHLFIRYSNNCWFFT